MKSNFATSNADLVKVILIKRIAFTRWFSAAKI